MNNKNYKISSKTINSEQCKESSQDRQKIEKGVVTPVPSYKLNNPKPKSKK
jgi:hypothetical protein